MEGWIPSAAARHSDTFRSPTPLNMTWLHVEHLDRENREEKSIAVNPSGHQGTRREILKHLSST